MLTLDQDWTAAGPRTPNGESGRDRRAAAVARDGRDPLPCGLDLAGRPLCQARLSEDLAAERALLTQSADRLKRGEDPGEGPA
jgi:hypothetical protein